MVFEIMFRLAVALVILGGAMAACPNHCNAHGTCDKYARCDPFALFSLQFGVDITNFSRRCTCDEGYQGADCSERICPFGLAWADPATAIDTAHASAECSNRGICNRKTGEWETICV